MVSIPGLSRAQARRLFPSLSKLGQTQLDAQNAFALEPWFAALANRENAPAKELKIGDSITEGAAATSAANAWARRSGVLLRRNFPTPGVGLGNSFGHSLPQYFDSPTLPNPYQAAVLTAGGFTVAKDTGQGLGRRCGKMNGVGQSYTYSFTGTSFKVLGFQTAAGGVLGITIDGGARIDVNTAGSNLVKALYTSGALASGVHTVKLEYVSGGTFIYLADVLFFDGDEAKGIQSFEGGHYGWTSTQWITNNTTPASYVSLVAPSLVTITLGTNDYNTSIPSSTTKANIKTMIAAYRAGSSKPISFVLGCLPKRGDTVSPLEPWDNYVDAMYAIANEDTGGIGGRSGVAVWDASRRFADFNTSNVLGSWAADKVHPLDLLHLNLGESWAQFVSPR